VGQGNIHGERVSTLIVPQKKYDSKSEVKNLYIKDLEGSYLVI